nr:wall-associated kinase family protein [Tanacetum cinerariifolium]
MKLLQVYRILLVIFLSLTTASIAAPVYAKPGCNDMCGNVRIPFPFGIGANCSVNGWYVVNCNSSIPYLSALDNLEVLSVDLGNQTVTVNMQKISNCSQTNSVDLSTTPFVYSKSHNRFVFEGCGNAVMMGDHGNVLTACSTTCSNVDTTTTISVHRNNKCVGINCCETTIPHYLKSYSMNLTSLERPVGGNGTCGSAFLVDENSYIEGSRLSHQSSVAEGGSYVQTSLLWTISDLEHLQVTCDKNNPWGYGRIVNMGNGTLVNTWKCHYYESSAGNPYLINGCNDYRSVSEECSRCEDRGGYCRYDTTYDVDDLIYNNKFTCGFYRGYSYEEIRSSRTSLGVMMGTRDELMVVANLAMGCLNLNGRYRPTMKEVATELESIRTIHIPSIVKSSIKPMIYGEEPFMLTTGESTSTFLSSGNTITQ